ncbi:hypothetical protein CPZ58_08565 [Bifidobacterium bifidum]|nr:hypothetical protein CPZ58_08565 [Bifidobacterium bifidum]
MGFVPVGPGAVSGSSVVAVVVARNQLIARSIGSRDNRPLLQRAPTRSRKLRVEIAVLGNSPCENVAFGPENGDFARGITDFGYFNP